jgi:hypothetical protein
MQAAGAACDKDVFEANGKGIPFGELPGMISMDRQGPRPQPAVQGRPTALRMTHRDKTAVSSRRFLAFRLRGPVHRLARLSRLSTSSLRHELFKGGLDGMIRFTTL